MKESDGHVVIKAVVSGHRRFSLQVVARSFVPTRFNLPAGQLILRVLILFAVSYHSKQ